MSNDREVIYDPLHELMARFENVKAVDTSVDPFEGLSVEDSLKKHIIDGVKKNLERRLEAGCNNTNRFRSSMRFSLMV